MRTATVLRFLAPAILGTGAVLAAAAHASEAAYKHLGAASCAASVCHGKLTPQTGRDVSLNEYRVWLLEDRHSQAYRGLDAPAGRAIAQKLGLASAQTAKICLDCHADNVSAALRGPKFQLSDGVGCEACHGGAEKWIESHAQQGTTHAMNVANGMSPTEQPGRRAAVCLQCHLGTQDRFATHQIMGAGHPRLRFELDTFTANQPAHFVVDADYVKRKGRIEDVNLWVSGELEGALRLVTLEQSSPYFHQEGLMPEFAFYDCYSCHHTIDSPRWSSARAGPGIKPGTLRVQKAQLIMLQALAEVVGPPAAVSELSAATAALSQASQRDIGEARAAAGKLADWLRAHQGWVQRSFSRAETASLRKMLLRYAGNDKASDFLTAEQVVLGVESLSYGLGDHEKRKSAIDALYDTVKSNASFNPQRFAEVSRSVEGQF
jgi:hypothetical protein